MNWSKYVAVLGLVAAAGCGSKKPSKHGPGSGTGTGTGSGTAASKQPPVLAPAAPLPTPAPGMPPLPDDMQAITPEQVALGELLFFEPRISADGKTTCAGCHDPERDWAGGPGRPTAKGDNNLRRALNLSDLAWRANLGWDGRYKTVENHLYQHVRGQLANDPVNAIQRIAGVAGYRAQFARAFNGSEPDGGRMITALAAFARTRYSAPAPWDSAEHGTAPTPDQAGTPEARGYLVFTGKAQCATCHVPPLYTDQAYYRLGLIKSGDDGRGKIDVDRKGAFKTPPLRGAALRPAFFHDGSAPTLEAAIDWHLAGGTGHGADKSIVELPAVTLTAAERDDLIAFVRALSPASAAPYPRPALPP